jgi:hypothetical protein
MTTTTDCAGPGEPSTKVEKLPIGPGGALEDVIVPNLPCNTGTPTVSGPFRMLPFGYSETRTPRTPVPARRRPDDDQAFSAELMRTAPFYVEIDPSVVPVGFEYSAPIITELDGKEVRTMLWMFDGPLAGYIVVRRGFAELPFGVKIPPHDAFYTVERTTIGANPGVLQRAKTGGPNTVIFVEQNVITVVDGHTTMEDVLKLANAIAGASTVE